MNGWGDFFNAAAASLVTGIISFFSAWALAIWRLKRQGINSHNAQEIIDRGEFRKHLLERVDHVEELHEDCLQRELVLIEKLTNIEKRLKSVEDK